ADVDGHDACRKICILSSLAFGRHIYPEQIPTEGIRGVTLADVAYAEACGSKIKLLGRAIRQADGRVCAYVAPHLVSVDAPLSGVEDVFNAIAVKGDAIGDVMFYGRGAGKLPTASAVVADVMDAARRMKMPKYLAWGPGGENTTVSTDGLVSAFYVRVEAGADAVHAALGTVRSLARAGAPAGETAFLTEPLTRPALDVMLNGLTVKTVLRVLD
ncbi:MAG: homoserine dehydrogenase, partial [Pseudoflavonifractor sp.]